MKKILLLGLIVTFNLSCEQTNSERQKASWTPTAKKTKRVENRSVSEDFKSYWYTGVAELTSYELQQARYGNLNEGHAVLVFVTEPFETGKQVKADRPSDQSTSVLKLNATKKFLTGIYPYSVMTSTFHPVWQKSHALKVTHSMQEWCGHVYSQLNNRKAFQIKSHSYFESEGDQELELEKTLMEDEMWTLIRLAPQELPLGEYQMLPSFEYLRLKHKPFQSYAANLSLETDGELTVYTISYPELERTIKIKFTTAFPHAIEGWEESAPAGFRAGGSLLTTTAKRIERIQMPYWMQNGPQDEQLRSELGL